MKKTGMRFFAALLLALCASAVMTARRADAAAPPAFELLWRDAETRGLAWRTFDAAGKPLDAADFPDPPIPPGRGAPFVQKAPLGSLWKLFVYLWLVETDHPAPPYRCAGARGKTPGAAKLREEEAYCCDPGQSIDRDAALVRSCGLFFAPDRLGLTAAAWRDFWRAGAMSMTSTASTASASWLADLAMMRPETVVTPAGILRALEAAPPRAREKAMAILLATAFGANGEAGLARHMGGQSRVKTFSWFRPDDGGRRYGGGAGWLADGTPVWFAGEGTGQQVMAKFGKTLAAALPATRTPLAPGCVRVRLFARHPLTRVERAGGGRADAGTLRGDYVAVFEKGKNAATRLPFRAGGEIRLSLENGRPRLEARLGLDDYVARVLDREADATATEAARALAVVVRAYLLDKAAKHGNCLVIEDSSHTQRVSANPPSAAARVVAGFTSGLVLAGAPVGFHGDKAGENRMAWTEALAAGKAGKSWDVILRDAFPKARLAALHDPTGLDCRPFPAAERWLGARAEGWRRALRERLPGFEPPPPPQICLLPYGNPFSEQDRNRIHLRALKTVEDRIALAHEYLHLGLAGHPSGHDEALVERWARNLAGDLTGNLPENGHE
ncbi:MAG: DUF2300 domain-containing protein [Candidatus Accumulibacter sp.]|nr:DUF2300 domain-containing protein [Accumulibacter sp.]